MKYVLLNQNVVREIIPEYDPIFPGVPIKQRYSNVFLQQCITIEDTVEVTSGDIYNPETQKFTSPVIKSSEEESNI